VSHRRHDAQLGHVSPDDINHQGLLADKELAGAMEHWTALLLGRLGLYKPLIGPWRFADGFGVSGLVLLPLDLRLHVGQRHQAHDMPERRKFTRPMMRRGTGLDPNQARRQMWKAAVSR
jgi:hypothetical protein